MTPLIGPKQLLELVVEPNAADVGTSEVEALALDLRDACWSSQQAQAIKGWLSHQPIPVLGLLPQSSEPKVNTLDSALDLVLDCDAEVELALEHIHRNPLATAVLVQVTRATAKLPIHSALTVESLGYATLQSGAEFAHWLAHHGPPTRAAAADDPIDPVKIDRDGTTLRIGLNSPGNRNALSVAMRDGLAEAFKLVALDRTIEHANVTGTGPCFSAGGDLTEFGTATDLALAHHIRQRRMPAQYLAAHAEKYRFNLHGACIGAGIELPAFAHHVTAKPNSFFQLPEISMGLIPGAGGCVSIPRRVGRQRMNFIAITGTRLNAEDALRWGLIDEIDG